MIHSTAGGIMREKKFFYFAKVRLESGEICFYICKDKTLKENDMVLVPFGNDMVKGTILRIDKNVSQDVAPIPVKRAKEIFGKV